jgi:hypothetical protein
MTKNITLDELKSLDESTIKAILDEISKNPSIILPWYKTKSEILELIDDLEDNDSFIEIKNTIESGLSDKMDDCMEYNVPEWI